MAARPQDDATPTRAALAGVSLAVMDTTDPFRLPQTTDPYVSRTPEDVLATVPLVLGFEPEESVVMLTFGAARAFHARIDLPREAAHLPVVASALVDPALRHGVPRVLLVGYHEDGRWTEEVLGALAARFESAGIRVVTLLRAHRGRWWTVDPTSPAAQPGPGAPYDSAGHRFRVRSVLEGRVTRAGREELVASVAAEAAAPSAALLEALERAPVPAVHEVDVLLGTLLESGERPDDAQVATLLKAAALGGCRDQVYRRLPRSAAAQHVSLWSDVVRRAPEAWAADAAGLLAMAAWVSGDGALAWCAVDRAESLEPGHSVARLVGDLLQAAVPPEEWEQVRGPLAGWEATG